MSFVRTKEIPAGSGNFYLYRVHSERKDGTVKQIYEAYLGKEGGGGVRGGRAGLFKFLEEVRGETPPPLTKTRRRTTKKETEEIIKPVKEKERVEETPPEVKVEPIITEEQYVKDNMAEYKDSLTKKDRKSVEAKFAKDYQDKLAKGEFSKPAEKKPEIATPLETEPKGRKPRKPKGTAFIATGFPEEKGTEGIEPAKPPKKEQAKPKKPTEPKAKGTPAKEVKSTGVAEALNEIDNMVGQGESKTEPVKPKKPAKELTGEKKQSDVRSYKIAPQPLVNPFEGKPETEKPSEPTKPEAKKPEPIVKKEQSYKLSPEMNKHIKSIKTTNEKEYAQKYAHFLATGDKKDEPQRGNLTAEKAKALRADIYNIQNPEEKPEKPAEKKSKAKTEVYAEPIVTNAESVVVNAEPVVANAEPIVVEVKPKQVKVKEAKPSKEKTETFTPQFKGFDTYIIKKEPDLFKISGFKYSVYTEDDTPLEISGDSAREAEMNLRRQKKVRAVIVKD